MVEVHPAPEDALCDADQLIPTDEFAAFAKSPETSRRSLARYRGDRGPQHASGGVGQMLDRRLRQIRTRRRSPIRGPAGARQLSYRTAQAAAGLAGGHEGRRPRRPRAAEHARVRLGFFGVTSLGRSRSRSAPEQEAEPEFYLRESDAHAVIADPRVIGSSGGSPGGWPRPVESSRPV